jgi:hypothetical protein
MSKLQRVAICAPSAVLPQDGSENSARERGNAVHDFLHRVGSGADRDTALEQVPEEHHDACAAIDLARLPILTGLAAEVAFAYDVETGHSRELGRGLERNYSGVRATELPGTADLVGLIPDGQGLFLGDWKTGRVAVSSALKSWQLRALALAACRAYGRSYAIVALITLHGDVVKYDQARLDLFDLASSAAELRAIVERVRKAKARAAAGERPEVVSGAHCRYCPAFAHCPAQVALVRQLAIEPVSIEREVMTLLTPETATRAWGRLKQVEAIVKRVRETLYGWAEEHPIDCGNGMVFGPVEAKKRELSGQIARKVLLERHGAEVADAACTFETSQAAIERALKPVAPNGGLAKLKRETIAEIEMAGGLTVKRVTRMEEHLPTPAAGDAGEEKAA